MNRDSLRTQRKQKRRERLEQAALKLFSLQGFQETTISQISAAAGVSRGTFFNHFPYKEAVLLDALGRELAAIEQSLAGQVAAGAPERLRGLFSSLALLVEERQELVLPLSRELLHPDPVRSRAALFALPLPGILSRLITQGQQEGLIRGDQSAERLARVLANTFFVTALQWAGYRRDKPLREELDMALKLALEGFLQRED